MDPIPLSLPFLMDGATGTELQKRGWYPTQEAPAEKVQQAKLKFSNPS